MKLSNEFLFKGFCKVVWEFFCKYLEVKRNEKNPNGNEMKISEKNAIEKISFSFTFEIKIQLKWNSFPDFFVFLKIEREKCPFCFGFGLLHFFSFSNCWFFS
jgi:hypothetical protein